VVAMDGFGGYKTAAVEQLPEATAVMDPFHVLALAGAKLDLCRQRIQQQTCGHRGRTGDPLYRVRRTLRTRYPLLNTRQKARLEAVFADENHLAVELCWGFYQRLIAAYAHPDRRRGKTMMTTIIDALRTGVPAVLEELAQLGRTLHRRRHDVLAYFEHHASNGPTEAINGRLEALRRNALGFRNLTHYRIRSLLHCGNLAHRINALWFRKSRITHIVIGLDHQQIGRCHSRFGKMPRRSRKTLVGGNILGNIFLVAVAGIVARQRQ
jgi:transposase